MFTAPILSLTPALATEGDANREIPDASVGVGLGVAVGTQLPTLDQPEFDFDDLGRLSFIPFNVASLRIRPTRTLEIEPSVGFLVQSTAERRGDNDRTTSTGLAWTGGVLARVALADRGPVQLQGVGYGAVGGAARGTGSNARTMSMVGLGWGIGVTWWASERFSLSGDATNPLLQSTRFRRGEGDARSVESATDLGLILSPTVRMMGHVWF
jgi:hypothetical protein